MISGVPVCACDQHRRNPKVKAPWKAVMPQAVCDEMRRQRNIRSRRSGGG